jgi:ATP-dependent Clp protease adaptor protein ClpS
MLTEGSKGVRATPGKSHQTTTLPQPTKPRPLPMFRVILHNDDANDMHHVVETIVMLTPLNAEDAVQRMLEAHATGAALLLVTHKERAELYMEQFQSRRLTVTIEPAD